MNKFESMKQCRTCYWPQGEMHSLGNPSARFPNKTLSELFKEAIKIEVTDHTELPYEICSLCLDEIQKVYEFFLQVQETLHWWSGTLDEECLSESLIDMQDTKKENDLENVSMDLSNEEVLKNAEQTNKDEAEFDIEHHQELKSDDDKIDDPITLSNAGSEGEEHPSDEPSSSKRRKSEKKSPKSCRPMKRKRGRPRLKNSAKLNEKTDDPIKEIPKDDKNHHHKCLSCEKDFLSSTDLQDHCQTQCQSSKDSHLQNDYKEPLRTHTPKSPRNLSYLFGNYLYSEKPFALRKCQICEENFSKSSLLKKHLMEHATLQKVDLTPTTTLLKKHFPNENNLEKVKDVICKNLKEENFEKFFLIQNHFGYEMSLSDEDEPDISKDKYKCELCPLSFNKKCKLFIHSANDHEKDLLPFECKECNLGFSSKEVFESHSRTHCLNEAKNYKCSQCPGKFMWSQSLAEHLCPATSTNENFPKKINKFLCDHCDKSFKSSALLNQHKKSDHISETILKENQSSSPKQFHSKKSIKCCLCSEEFGKLSALREHLAIHSDGFTQCKPDQGLFYKVFHSKATEEEDLKSIGKEISEDFKNSNLFKFYFAADNQGNEMLLNDSDSDSETETTPSKESKYFCDLCLEGFGHLKHLMAHQNVSHYSLEASKDHPHHCPKCQQGFVSLSLLERHLKKDCNSYLPISFRCTDCNLSFIWLDNYNKHYYLKHFETAEPHLSQQHEVISKNPKEQEHHRGDVQSNDAKTSEKEFIDTNSMREGLPKTPHHRSTKPTKYSEVDENLCKPHGCKHIQCMICLSKHSKISDLRVHLSSHETSIPINIENDGESLKQLVERCYPNETSSISDHLKLLQRIKNDIAKKNFETFYNITNENGYELRLSSSETETESESETDSEKVCRAETNKTGKLASGKRKYLCNVCGMGFKRKFLLFRHHRNDHVWLEGEFFCQHCQARFLCEKLLKHHYATQCKNLKKRFNCRKCPLKFMWQENLKTHFQKHLDEKANHKKVNPCVEKSFECVDCNRKFSMLKDLTRHMVMHNSDSYNLKCNWCPRKFYKKTNLIIHVRRHGIPADSLNYAETMIKFYYNSHGKKEIFCKICKVHFNKVSSLREHLKLECSKALKTHEDFESLANYSITNDQGFELDVEDSETDDEENKLIKQYTCQICNLNFKRKYQMALHQKSVHKYEALPLKCEKCIFRTVSLDILKYHKKTQCDNSEKCLECPQCSFRFKWLENLEAHKKLMHKMVHENSETSSSLDIKTPPQKTGKVKGEFACVICPCKYNRKESLDKHMKKSHPLEMENENFSSLAVQKDKDSGSKTLNDDPSSSSSLPTKKNKAAEKKFLCAFCGKAVTSSSNLVIHMRRHTGEKPFKCDFCDMAFPRSSDLQCHRRTHTGEKPYQCTVCEKAFARSHKLQQHMRIHSGERPYKCTYCEKSFAQSNDLTLHIRRHTGERPYICGICGERFIQGSALKNHRFMRGHFEEVTLPKTRAILEQF